MNKLTRGALLVPPYQIHYVNMQKFAETALELQKRIKNLPRYRYEAVAFLSGFSLLVLEISGGRLIAPYFGSSTYVWTAVIGVILGALACGSLVGGRLADISDPATNVSRISFGAACAVLGMSLLQRPILGVIAERNLDLRISAYLAALVLFGIPSVLIGVLSPNLAKLQVTSLRLAGTTIGRLEAAGTLGSIVGTFVSGYFLLGFWGSRSTILAVAATLFVTSLLSATHKAHRHRLWLIPAIALAIPIVNTNPAKVIADIDSAYSRYQVWESVVYGQPARTLVTDAQSVQSAISVTNPGQPLAAYIGRFYDIAQIAPTERMLVIGGGTYTFPSIAITNLGERIQQLDVVEIDKQLLPLAQEYFFLEPSSKMHVYHEDGRTYLNRQHELYDLIYLDAFSSITPPFQLTTKEAVRGVANNLKPEGAAIVNIVSTYSDGEDPYLTAVFHTYKTAFQSVEIFPASGNISPNTKQNFILVATNNNRVAEVISQHSDHQSLTIRPVASQLVLSDDFAPVERLTY